MNYYTFPGLDRRDQLLVRGCKRDKIIEIVCTAYRLSLEDIKSRSRVRKVTVARQILCYMLYEHTKTTIVKIGELINRDHSTVIYNKDIVRELCFSDKGYKKHFEQLEKLI